MEISEHEKFVDFSCQVINIAHVPLSRKAAVNSKVYPQSELNNANIFFICQDFGYDVIITVAFLFISFHTLSGIIGERLPIRYYLTVGMLASGLFTAMFGLGYFYNIHNLWFYIMAQVGTMLFRYSEFPWCCFMLYWLFFQLPTVISGWMGRCKSWRMLSLMTGRNDRVDSPRFLVCFFGLFLCKKSVKTNQCVSISVKSMTKSLQA